MALSSEDRSAFNDYARNLRAFPALIAVADHLAACEALLGEIDDCLLNFEIPDRDGHTTLNFDVARDWQARIRALLGPAATEEVG